MRWLVLLLEWLFVPLAVVLLVSAFYQWSDTRELLENGIRTEVESYASVPVEQGDVILQAPQVFFTLPDGFPIPLTLEELARPEPYEPGDTFALIYPPDAPGQVRLDEGERLWRPAIWTAVGGVFSLVIGLAASFVYERRFRRSKGSGA